MRPETIEEAAMSLRPHSMMSRVKVAEKMVKFR